MFLILIQYIQIPHKFENLFNFNNELKINNMNLNKEPIISDWLEKKIILGFWTKRFCVLIDNILYIYKDNSCSNIDFLIEIKSTTKIEYLNEGNLPRFKITSSNGETIIFATHSFDLMVRWILALRSIAFTNPEISMENFNVLSVIGRGYYGKVMLCEDKISHELYAIKSIHKNKLIEDHRVHTVLSERNILARVHHPFIVSLKFAFQTHSKFYLGLEYLSGGELFYHLKKRGNIPIEEVKLYAAQIALALDYIHSLGIIYRDIKPENILLDSNGYIKLTDFGLSKDLSHSISTSTFCGTLDYLAPEMIKKEKYTEAIDWWDLGILIYELLFGKTPFFSDNRSILFDNILKKDVEFPSDINIEPDVKQCISLLLTKDPKKRPKFNDIKKFSLFSNLNFDDIFFKKFQPIYVPKISNDPHELTSNFDKEFTDEHAFDSFVSPIDGPYQEYPGFSYREESFDDFSLNITSKSFSCDRILNLAPSNFLEENEKKIPHSSSNLIEDSIKKGKAQNTQRSEEVEYFFSPLFDFN